MEKPAVMMAGFFVVDVGLVFRRGWLLFRWGWLLSEASC